MKKPILFQTGDIETFKEFFCLLIKENKTGKKELFMVNKYVNDLKRLYTYLTYTEAYYNWFMFSYNGNGFDWIILNYIIANKKKFLIQDSQKTVSEIYNVNKRISEIYKNPTISLYQSEFKKYMYNFPFMSIDLMCFWTISTIKQKQLSLKYFEVSLDLSVEECPIAWDKTNLTEEECLSIAEYCENDVDATISLADRLTEKVNSRFDVLKEYKLKNCLSWDDVKIGYETLLIDIAKENKVTVESLPSKTIHTSVKLADIIIPELEFTSKKTGNIWKEKAKSSKKGETTIITCFDNFSDMLDFIKKQEVRDTTSLSLRVIHKGIIHDIKSGGLHSYHTAELRRKQEGYIYRDVDVSSYYPTMGAERNFVPEHLKKYKFSNVIKKIKNERIIDKLEGRIGKANIKKLMMNGGFYGNTNQPFRRFYDWKCTLQITINGQLMLLKLVEMQTKNPLIIEDMVNT